MNLETSQKESTVVRHGRNRVDRTVCALKGAVCYLEVRYGFSGKC